MDKTKTGTNARIKFIMWMSFCTSEKKVYEGRVRVSESEGDEGEGEAAGGVLVCVTGKGRREYLRACVRCAGDRLVRCSKPCGGKGDSGLMDHFTVWLRKREKIYT